MKSRLEGLLDTTLARSPAQPIFRWKTARELTILAYHDIVDPYRFGQQLDYLVTKMRPVSLDEVLAALGRRHELPKHAVLVTFDDGDRSLIDFAMPMLNDRGIPGVAFIIAGLLDTVRPFWWVEAEELVRNGGTVRSLPTVEPGKLVWKLKKIPDDQRLAALAELRQTAENMNSDIPQLRRAELAELESAGIAIGNHTLTHPCLNRCSDDRIRDEISQAHSILTSALGRPPEAFSYPNGDFDERAVATLSELSYGTSFLFDHRISTISYSGRFRISRVRVNSDTCLDRFCIIVSGLHPAIHHFRSRISFGA